MTKKKPDPSTWDPRMIYLTKLSDKRVSVWLSGKQLRYMAMRHDELIKWLPNVLVEHIIEPLLEISNSRTIFYVFDSLPMCIACYTNDLDYTHTVDKGCIGGD